jgi:hypothetical protein
MLRRLLCLGLVAGVVALVLGGIGTPACYQPPEPNCGFVCGDNNACPPDFHCVSSDDRCHRNGSPASLMCGPTLHDAPPLADGHPDGAPDAPRDAPHDAQLDAPHDAARDAPADARMIDAPVDARPVDAPLAAHDAPTD